MVDRIYEQDARSDLHYLEGEFETGSNLRMGCSVL